MSDKKEESGTETSPLVEVDKPEQVSRSKSKIEKKEDKKEDKKDAVSAQTERFNTPGTIWYAVKTGNRDDCMKFIAEDESLLVDRGPVGETPLHLCFLFNQPAQKQIAQDLIEKYPSCVTAIYENDLYHGETYLHITIVNRDLEMTRWLVEKEPKLLKMPADGKFFQKDSPCYYGELPLSFAASTNNAIVFEYLLHAGADLWAQDSYGHNVLHMCVWHKLKKMYTLVLEIEAKILAKIDASKKPKATLAQQRNKKGLTPFLLAAYQGDEYIDMLEFILDKSKDTQWTYGPVSCNIYPLDELDTLGEVSEIDDEVGGYKGPRPSALQIIVKKRYLKLLMISRLIDLLHKKWKGYAEKYFYKRCINTFTYILMLSIAIILRDPGWFNFQNDNFKDSYTGVRGVFKGITIAFTILGWAYKGFNEGSELISNGLSYFRQAGAAFLENNLSFSFLVALPIAWICELAGSLNTANFFVAAAALFAWCYTLALLLGFELTGPFVIMIHKMITSDVARFIIIYLVILIGYSVSFYAIDMPSEWGQEFDYIFYNRIYKLFLTMLGGLDFEDFNSSVMETYIPYSSLLLLSYVIIITILLLNLLIAMMGDTFGQVKEMSREEWHLAYAQIIFSIESELPEEFWTEKNADGSNKNFEPYWTVIGGKRFLQVQEVNSEWYSEIEKLTEASADFAKFDVNQDGVVTFEEYQAAMTKLDRKNTATPDKRRSMNNDVPLGPQDSLPGRVPDHLS